MNILLENNLLIFNREDLVGEEIYFARQIEKSATVKLALEIYSGPFQVYRIGDKQSDKLKMSSKYQCEGVLKFCTKPELEIILILSCDLWEEFEKQKSKVSAKTFAKQNIIHQKEKYNNSSKFYRDYFGRRPVHLADCFRQYKSLHAHRKDELYVADLLK